MWGFLAAIISPLIEKFLVWLFKLIKKDLSEWREQREAKQNAEKNAKKVIDSKTDEERRNAVEDLLNND